MSKKNVTILEGLSLVSKQWKMFSLAFFASILIMSLDFLLTISIPKIIDGLENIILSGEISSIPISLIILCSLIILRPLIGWIINYIQISIILNILRKLESNIVSNSKKRFTNSEIDYSSENAANMLISHGRYFVDNFLIPLIRAITDLGTIFVIAIGILLQYPIPLVTFLTTAFLSLAIYQFLSRSVLRINGEIVLRCYEEIMKSSRIGHENQDEITKILNRKKTSTIILGSVAQGIKYVVEFSFMLSFGFATIIMFFYSADLFVAFVATFAYAGVRMLPSFTSVISFLQSRSAADQAIRELVKHLSPNKKL